MRKMFSKKQIEEMRDDISSSTIVSKIAGQDIAPADITSSGDLLVSGSINGEENPSVKPIYCHPIRIYTTDNTDDTSYMMSIMIFNNSATPINSRTALINWLTDLYNLVGSVVTVNASGFYKTITSTAYMYIYSSGGTLHFGVDGRGSTNKWISIDTIEEQFLDGTCYVSDGVNKIN